MRALAGIAAAVTLMSVTLAFAQEAETTVEPEEIESEPEEIPLEPEPQEQVEAAMALVGEVFGTVRDETGEPVASAEVIVEIQDVRLTSRTTDSEGKFRMLLPAGTHQLEVQIDIDGEERRGYSGAVVQPGESRQIDIELIARNRVSSQEPGVSLSLSSGSSGHRPRATSGGNIVAEAGTFEVGGRLDAFASDVEFGGQSLGITDAVILALSNRYSFGFLEISLDAGLLVKQANFMDENVFQNASLTLRVPMLEWLVPYVRGSVGTMRGAGIGYGSAAGLFARATVGRFITFEGSIGGEFLYFNSSGLEDLWLVETMIEAQAMIHGDRQQAGIGLGTRYTLPVAHNGTVFDPGISLSFYVLAVVSLEEDWDIYLEGALVDRGEVGSPETQLPVLSGGFDQTRISFGVNYHLRPEEHE